MNGNTSDAFSQKLIPSLKSHCGGYFSPSDPVLEDQDYRPYQREITYSSLQKRRRLNADHDDVENRQQTEDVTLQEKDLEWSDDWLIEWKQHRDSLMLEQQLEFEKRELDAMIKEYETISIEKMLCPLCQQHEWCIDGTVLSCPCGLAIDFHVSVLLDVTDLDLYLMEYGLLRWKVWI
jgi:hypothetical protein